MSEHANINKGTKLSCKYKGIGKLIALDGLYVSLESIDEDGGQLTLSARSRAHGAICPCCGSRSTSVHSSYIRTVADLPVSGRNVLLRLLVRRFRCRCMHEDGKSHIFSERFCAVECYRRKTVRTEELILHTSLETSARKAEFLLDEMGIKASDSSCLRLIMRQPIPETAGVKRIGIDDWAWRKGMRYGTQIVDQDTGRTIDLLKTRSTTDIVEWLGRHKDIEVITRDRDKGYGAACRTGAPNAEQIADRFHVSENLSDRIKEVIRDNSIGIYSSYSSWLQGHDSELLPSNTGSPGYKVQFDLRNGYSGDISGKDRKDYEMVGLLKDKGMQVAEIAKKLHIDRGRAWMFFHHDIEDIKGILKHDRKMALYKDMLPDISAMCDKGWTLRRIYKDLVKKKWLDETFGQFKYWLESYNPEYTARRKENTCTDMERLKKALLRKFAALSVGTLSLYVTNPEYGLDKDTGTRSQTARLVDEAVKACSLLGYLRNAAVSFRKVLAGKDDRRLGEWMDKYKHTEYPPLASFWNGLLDDIDAVKNAIRYKYSNGIVEGKNHRLKNKKREAYGRAGFELLRRKVILSEYG